MRLGFLVALTLLLSACSSLSTKDTATTQERWQQRLEQQRQIQDWSFRGRTAIVQDREGWNASLSWTQQADQFLIKLAGPFSQGGATLEGNDNQVVMTLDDGRQFQAATPEQLLAEQLGWRLPVSALRDWLRGIPYEKLTVDNQTFDDHGRLEKLEQAGWQVDYLSYMPFENTVMPAKVFMKHPDLNIRVIIQRWSRPE